MQANAYPELSILQPVEGVLEIRVYNRNHLRVYRRTNFLGYFPLLFGLLLLGVIHIETAYPINYYINSFLTLLCLYNQCTQVIYESVQIIAFYGIQLETARGIRIPFFSPVSLISRKRFIALPYIQDIVINEGLWGWNVRYYLCVIKDTQKDLTLEVVFENLLPKLPVLEIVYNTIHDYLAKIS